jgi:VWFA-related protein
VNIFKIQPGRPAGKALALLAAAFVIGGAAMTLGRTQNQAPSQAPSFQVAARLVELTVVAVDKDGNPVKDLKKEDFTLFDNNKIRDLSLCRYEGAPVSDTATAPALPPYLFTNRLGPGGAEDRNLTALVLDFANTDVQDQMFVKAQTSSLLRGLAPKTRVAIYVLGTQLRVIHDYTDDMGILRANLSKVRPEVQSQRKNDVEQAALDLDEILDQIEARKTPYAAAVFESVASAGEAAIWADVNNNAFVTGNRVEATLAALESLGRHLQEIPGRKNVVWISSGISLFAQRAPTTPNESVNWMSGDNLGDVIRKTSRRLAQFGVALYGVDARGLTTASDSLAQRQYPPSLAGRYSEVQRAEANNIDSRSAFSLMTSVTGGRFVFGTNDLTEGVNKVSADLQGSYSIGFYPSEEPDGEWHTFKVVVKRPDVQLLYKQGYWFDAAPVKGPAWDAEAKLRAMTNPLGSDSIRLNAVCAPASGADPGTLQLDLQIEAEDLYWHEDSGRSTAAVDIFIGEKASDGSVRYQQSRINARLLPPQMETARARGLPFRRLWKPGDDTVKVRILVRDEGTGRIGTIDIPMPLAAVKK